MGFISILSNKTTTTNVTDSDIVNVGVGVSISTPAQSIVGDGGSFTLFNAGSLFSTSYAVDGYFAPDTSKVHTIVNYATGIIGSYFAGIYTSSNLKLINHGLISALSYGLFGGHLGGAPVTTSIYNDGTIEAGTYSIQLSIGTYSIENAGLIRGNILASSLTGNNGIFNSTNGQFTGSFFGGGGTDTVIAGQVSCTIYGNNGNDVLYANPTLKAAENRAVTTLSGGLGDNVLYGGGAFTTFILGTWGGNDQVWGSRSLMADVSGYLNNTAQFSDATQGVYVDLLSGHNAFINDSAGAWDGSGVFADWIQNVPNITGSAYGDVIQADGSGGKITGAGGADALYGATGRDVFAFTAYGETNTVSGYDTVVNFERGTDKIDLSAFMAASGLGPGSLVIAGSGNSSTVYVERTPGTFNSATDLAFIVNSTAGVLTAADFIL